VRADKAVRAGAWASLAHGGLVHLVAGSWNGPFLEEVEQFPLGAHDDQVDAVSGAYELTLQRLQSAANLPVFRVGRPRPAC
jgi:predicted phage terminase large subunit-like protein